MISSVIHLPWQFTLAPIYEYGSGQPWTHRLGYDFNGDGKNSDRPAGVVRNSEDGPPFRQLSLRLTKSFRLLTDQRLEVIAEAFNLTNTPPFSNPNGTVGSSAFGFITSTIGGAADSRVLRVALRLSS